MSAAAPLVGVVHLGPLPGSPRYGGSLRQVLDAARRDADAYREGGASALIVENFHDVPFRRDEVEPQVVASMTLVVATVVAEADLPVGVNVLRNDARAALAIATVCGAAFIRVNVHGGAFVTDQGLIQGRADETLRQRAALGADTVAIWADLLVKHAAPLAPIALADAAEDLLLRELADALILTGRATGKPAEPDDARLLRRRFPRAPLYIGSGVTPERVPHFLPAATGFIVGTWAKEAGEIDRPVDPQRVRDVRAAIETAS